ncbi:SAM-dependent chlorinase/fluorinase [Pontibacter sp. G13]|uniref:SAM hydrolase/SAM-dependent halogenase family protein n=1 Tax=Pontibacter sp. G13 TaxID=3074898 RepID=UPI0028895468|nr:SAM-dependent chlorinase/fluorinase [Pontibacter sp. G13]WNJ20936.1 SAM-dependent chlorinase/fluorinase [Pontibacter sp. G13]
MAIITLTTDLGDSSHYPAVLKGIILSMCKQPTLVDVTHNISDFDIMQAAFVVKHAYPAFPKGSIHLVGVDPGDPSQHHGIVVKHDDHYFIGADNGIMPLICGKDLHQARWIEHDGLFRTDYPTSFRSARVFAPTAAFLASGGSLEEIGSPADLKELKWGHPSYSNNCLRGKIIHIDKFGNAITNIPRQDFLSIKDDRRFEIFIRNVRLKRIVNTYSDVGKADALAIFGGSGCLEIAMRETSAADLLGLKVNDMITIEFS